MGCPPEVPVTGERKSVKILGAIELWRTQFNYRQDTVFNAATYLGFLEQLARRYRRQGAIMIQDNASYHKEAEVWSWFKSNRHWLEVHQLPPYSPELNPVEYLNNDMKGQVNKAGLPDSRGTLHTRIVSFMEHLANVPKHVISYFLNPWVQYAAPVELL